MDLGEDEEDVGDGGRWRGAVVEFLGLDADNHTLEELAWLVRESEIDHST